MSLTLKMIYGCLVGAWGGFIAWVLLDPVLRVDPGSPLVDALVNGAIVGVCVGGLTSAFLGVMEGSLKRALRGLAVGLVAGLVGGTAGLLLGELLFQAAGQAPVVRVGGWAVFGMAIGASEGVLSRSWRRLLFGVIGGLAGGTLGSLAFIAVRELLTRPDFSRALGFTILGALLGLFIGLAFKLGGTIIGVLRVISSGRNEGKEIVLDKDVIRIGRDDGGDLGLYGDKSIEFRHAEIRRETQGHVIYAINQAPVRVNGQSVVVKALSKGDRIQIGQEEIELT
ncbi:MAG: FHA domain-containing protein [Anaerolineae bacterium]|nr:FHA domain-containing protein [Anaerolineae bacterium]MCB0255842.1 FHA domain-containing protein [Anaerolineae bacterium]